MKIDMHSFFALDKITQLVAINRMAMGIGKEAPYDLNVEISKEDIQDVYDELNRFEEDPRKYFTTDNCIISPYGEIEMWDDISGYQATGCYINNELAF